jgi:hypothetical protein
MEPVVDGLAEKYQNQIEFRRIDALSPEGTSAYRAYNLLGHPAFIILNQQGELLWKGLGEQSSKDLEDQLIAVIQMP